MPGPTAPDAAQTGQEHEQILGEDGSPAVIEKNELMCWMHAVSQNVGPFSSHSRIAHLPYCCTMPIMWLTLFTGDTRLLPRDSGQVHPGDRIVSAWARQYHLPVAQCPSTATTCASAGAGAGVLPPR